jgi:translation initiation factor eIF-2B subunit delta
MCHDEDKAKQWIIEKLDEFANERIVLAIKKIAEEWKCLIMENDVLLTYGCSDIVELMVEHAFNSGLKFKLIIALGRPDEEAMLMAERLSKKGINCTFTLITGVPYMLKGVKKILVGCSAMLSNGCLVNTIGTATVHWINR